MLKVLGRMTSINVRKVLWAADEMGLSYTREEWGKPVRDPNVPEFLALNPNGQVPVLIEDGFVLWDSGAILRHLAQQAGSELWPAPPRQRALVDQWLCWQAGDLNLAWAYIVPARLRNTPPYPDPQRLAEAGRRWAKVMQVLEQHLAGGAPFVANGRFSLADIVIGLSVHRWMRVDFDKPALPAVASYYDRLRQRRASQPYLGDATP
jgi:glutathione S-transferase